MKEVKNSYGFDLEAANREGKVNPNGGTLAMGHPLGATGIRVLLNMIMSIKNGAKTSIGAICAGGGVGGSIILEKYE